MESNEAPQTRFVPIFEDPSIPALACGLEWPKVLAASRKKDIQISVNAGRALAREHGKRYGSLYSVEPNGEVSVVGLCSQPALEFPAAIAGAACVAAIYGNHAPWVLAAFRLTEDLVWVCAVEAQRPTRFDDRVVSVEQAQVWLHEEVKRGGASRVVVIGDADFHAGAMPVTLEELVTRGQELAQSHGLLLTDLVKAGSAETRAKRMRWALIGAGVTVAVLLVGQYRDYRAKEARTAAARAKLPPEVAWQRGVEEWARNTRLPKDGGLREALEAIYAQPLARGDWRTTEIACKRADVTWTCETLLKRPEASMATILDLEAAIGSTGKVKPLDLTQAKVSWSFKVEVKPLVLAAMPKLGDTISPLTAFIQQWSLAFPGVRGLPTVSPVQIAPASNPDGTVTAVDLNTASPKIFVARLSVQESPLRSMSVFLEPQPDRFDPRRIAWNALSVRVMKAEQPSVSQSALVVSAASGDVYAVQ